MPNHSANKFSIENIINHLGGGIFCCKNDDVLTVYYASKSFYDMIGYKENEITAFCGNEANYVMQKFMRAVIGTNNVDHCARV